MAKAPKYPGVVLMEFPGDDRVRASTASSTIARDSEVVSNYDFIDAIHNVPVGTNDSNGLTNYTNDTHGLTNYDYDGMVVMSEFGHEPFKSPRGSYAHTVQTATTGTTTRQKYRVLGTLTLVGIVYFATCGGPVGSEPIISAGGPLIGLLGILLYVLFCQIPLSLVVAELCCAFPENGGYAVWAMTALGPFWGFQVGYWSWVASVLNNAIYPGLIYSTIIEAYGVEASSTVVSFFMKAVIAVLLAAPSYFGVRFVGLGALVLLVIVVGTTLMFSVWGFAEGDGAWFRLKEIRTEDQVNDDNPDGGVDWSLLIHALFWSFDGLFDVSVIGGEVINPARTYPRVIIAAVSLTVLTYTFPYISAVVADKISWLEFSEDSYPDIAEAVGGSFLHEVAIFASVMSSIGMFSCTLFFQSFLVQGMAQSRLLPAKLRKRSARFKTPQYAIAFSLIMTLGLVGFDFESILNMTNAFSAIVQVIVVICMLLLRRSYPYLSRPMKVPGNMATLIVMLLPAMAVFIFTIITTLAEWKLALVVVGLTVPGLLFPLIRRRIAGRIGCC